MDRRVKFAAVSAIAAACIGLAGWQVYGMMNPGQRKLSAEEAAVQAKIDENLRASAPQAGGGGNGAGGQKDPTILAPTVLDPGTSTVGGAQKPPSR